MNFIWDTHLVVPKEYTDYVLNFPNQPWGLRVIYTNGPRKTVRMVEYLFNSFHELKETEAKMIHGPGIFYNLQDYIGIGPCRVNPNNRMIIYFTSKKSAE